ncbi:precorrin-6Y C5,15-methyltransferase (decarboxylating) subunit CbiT [Sulfuracidifex metallicus]|uniref:Probable cobalt-precorrin-6B C(15)-methyltransferase (decarboxylating) n=1 Tax=Sulfuracidifex metallicus DSM 6482 = JCM 9184 TaxID=523847 RepID=A0A6A9QL41_SULME|nr:precorrin-6Y C5,15-methyltransferase (decarboxylating) subunit CbiT [Sulfuracidifex metallicus]MUN28408.1 precorrin-6Y C5,15-methyltransferase (decarboxylating) subunit CbiT [Sulfuracidifex metallicus DSM 6482 = JCM 9184]WOE51074.1 precorrin-6Y C5,15-methyltransferase (decarboxylating) subunit CbiT [Sulfuracidifex metallicus DSM 6482 = JCM 9184]
MRERSLQRWAFETPGIPDSLFVRDEEVPMTKEEVRAMVISKLRLREGQDVLDVGCGTGSVTVEMALVTGYAVGIDENEKAIELTKTNADNFKVNIKLIQGHAPDVMRDLDKFDRIFIGGGSDMLESILEESMMHLKEGGRIVLDAIQLETATRAISIMSTKMDVEVTQITISKGMRTKTGTAMLARNPVFIISGELK